MTVSSGMSWGSVFQSRMLELPTNSTAPDGGGFFLSAASKAAISASKGGGFCCWTGLGGCPARAAAALTHTARHQRVTYTEGRDEGLVIMSLSVSQLSTSF